jgi:hypothetical protein
VHFLAPHFEQRSRLSTSANSASGPSMPASVLGDAWRVWPHSQGIMTDNVLREVIG